MLKTLRQLELTAINVYGDVRANATATCAARAAAGAPEQFREQMERDLSAHGPIVKAAGIKLE